MHKTPTGSKTSFACVYFYISGKPLFYEQFNANDAKNSKPTGHCMPINCQFPRENVQFKLQLCTLELENSFQWVNLKHNSY